MRLKNWTKLASADLWKTWRELFPSDVEAEATAIWMANRLVKAAARSTRARFYEVKDMFIERHQGLLVDGRQVREEKRDCRACYGSGDDGQCDRCDGTGVWRSRTLYVHNFVIGGQRYSFHSYVRPTKLLDEPGEDKEQFGGRFTDAEMKEMALPLSGLIRMLRWYFLASAVPVPCSSAGSEPTGNASLPDPWAPAVIGVCQWCLKTVPIRRCYSYRDLDLCRECAPRLRAAVID